MAKFKGAKWAQILTLMAAIAASIVSGVAEAKTYAKDYTDGLFAALAAGDVSFSSNNFSADNVAGALEELYTGVSNQAVSISTSTTSSGMLRSYTFSQGGTQIGVIDIPKDYVNNIIGIVTQDGSGNPGVFLKVNTAPTGADTPVYEYIDASGLVEYLTVGTQTGKMVTLTIDANHQITADIADGTLTKAKLASGVQTSLDKADSAYQKPQDGIPSSDMTSAVQTSLGKADSALQDADFEWATDSEINTAWAAAMTAAQTPASPAAGE